MWHHCSQKQYIFSNSAIVLRFALRKYIEEFIGYRRLHNGDIYLPPISHQQGYRHMMSIPLLTLIYAALC